ncbi:MAG: hypothetical protein J0I54_20525 [Bosea sp.]|uniref:hypothetical protein n=1 Tax=unclassified Bosea (in: a-proteobacteria) TaxID=2653178 RepID=UPI000968D111|nr:MULTISPECIES: hypothetical protein [unclassified Bosea (in: a-proteobacteria)]MBN9459025.1 hypothetical protein [Bosea sp. (in: a-proteobacteria)]OJV06232.1 MAG: hypothetical protein BGO20_08220 [Bosea sp. 67-29]
MSPVAARPLAGIIRFEPPPAAPAAPLQPICYLPTSDEIRAHGAKLLLRRALLSLVELACVGVFLAAVLIWAALGAGA